MATNRCSQIEYSDIVNVDLEKKKIKELIHITLQTTDKSWTIHQTKDKKVKIAYKKIGNSNAYTVRGTTIMDATDEKIGTQTFDALDYFYKSQECGYNDVYELEVKHDNTCQESRIQQYIDPDHQISYSSYNSGYWIVSDRDFVYMRTRFKKEGYKFNGAKYAKIVGVLGYSVDDKHPFYVEKRRDCVRGRIIRCGYVLTQTEDQKRRQQMQAVYILSVDPGGMIPQRVVNKLVPSKGMRISKFKKNWGKIRTAMILRKFNNGGNDFKKDHEGLFVMEP